jgi:hypothetical protein
MLLKNASWCMQRLYPSEGVRLKALGDEGGDVLPEELHHRLLLPAHQIQPGPGAFDRVLAASNSRNKSTS